MGHKYIYLFPYEKIPQRSKILIYGAGDVGQEYLKQMMLTKYATVLGFVDRAWDKYPQMVVPIYSPEQVGKISFDYIVLAFKIGNFALDVQQMLVRQGIPDEKIVFQGARKKPMPVLAGSSVDTAGDGGLSYAFDEAPVSIALKYGPGLGDAIIKKQLFMEIAKFAPMAKIDIYAPKASLWIPAIYRDMPNFHRAIDDGGVLYVDNQEKYGLSMSIFYLVQMDQVKYDLLDQYCPVLSDMARKIEAANAAYNLSIYPATQNAIHFARSIFRGWNCYTLYNYTGAFQLSSMQVPIPLDVRQRKRWQQMHLGDYVTINYGNGASSKGQKQIVSKQWPKEYFERLAELLKQVYPHIKLVQIGDKSADNLDHVDRYILGEDLELVKYILKGSLLHIDIEGGLMHLATQLGTKCVCILGPTQKELFAYPQNINIVSEKCHGCYCLYDNTYQCARGLEKPECMYDLTPDKVMNKIQQYFKEQTK